MADETREPPDTSRVELEEIKAAYPWLQPKQTPAVLQYQLPFLDALMEGKTLRLEHTRKGPVWRAVPSCTCGVGAQYEDDHDDVCAIWKREGPSIEHR